jgi:DNA repair protein RecN (Recombination protein N)
VRQRRALGAVHVTRRKPAMLLELSIDNFAIIDHLRLQLGAHLTVFTGETGAGKSILIDAVSALVGDRVGADAVRAGADRALVEGIFDVSALLAPTNGAHDPRSSVISAHDVERLEPRESEESEEPTPATLGTMLRELGIDAEDGTLILAREVGRSGRSTARINGRAVPLSALQQVAASLIDIHGQSAHLTLLRPEQHVYYLDRFAAAVALREDVSALVSQWRAARRELDALQRDERELERRAELLRFQVEEIEGAHLRVGEVEALERERRMLANAERLGELCADVHRALTGDESSEGLAAMDLLAGARRALDELLRLDPTLSEQAAALDEAMYRLEDVAAGVRSYQEDVAADPARLAEVEERLDHIARLRRKYGATIEEILAYGAEASDELGRLSHREERVAALQEDEMRLRGEIGTRATRLSQMRQEAAQALATAMERELEDLHMQRARFEVEIRQESDPNGVPAQPGRMAQPRFDATDMAQRYAFGPLGIDRVEFLIAPNPGEPFKPLARIASGGETSRLMLALKSILSAADAVPTLIFDEIDAGISGRAGQIVGEKLWQLARHHQVVCVTHLPQIAALGDGHFRVAKALAAGRTTAQVEALSGEARLAEISQLLGGTATRAASANAAELLERGAEWKAGSLAGAQT